jgi:hypothetical protein
VTCEDSGVVSGADRRGEKIRLKIQPPPEEEQVAPPEAQPHKVPPSTAANAAIIKYRIPFSTKLSAREAVIVPAPGANCKARRAMDLPHALDFLGRAQFSRRLSVSPSRRS